MGGIRKGSLSDKGGQRTQAKAGPVFTAAFNNNVSLEVGFKGFPRGNYRMLKFEREKAFLRF